MSNQNFSASFENNSETPDTTINPSKDMVVEVGFYVPENSSKEEIEEMQKIIEEAIKLFGLKNTSLEEILDIEKTKKLNKKEDN